jgi:glycosyltransferase involved in cell wall biosynthesis
MKPKGGTEILLEALNNHLGSEWNPNVNLMASTCRHENLIEGMKNVIWQQLDVDQDNVQLMKDKSFVDKVDWFIYGSNWEYEKYRMYFNIPEDKSIVIKNAIDPVPFIEKKPGKIKLIYTSTPWRGLSVLLDSFELLNRDDIELDVYSSTIIYGDGFANATKGQYEALFDRCKRMKNVNYMGYASNQGVRRAVQKAHIFAYPSVFQETSCLAALEAGAAGCKMVVTNFGALYETCSEWADYATYTPNRQLLAERFARVLETAINNYRHDDPIHKEQSDFYNKFWTWENRLSQWREFLNDTYDK